MHRFHSFGAALLIGLTATLVGSQTVSAQSLGSMVLTLTPHCTATDRSTCLSFEVQDAQYLKTAQLAAGDILDIDIVLTGPEYAQVESIRSWLQYDPTVLEARSVELTSAVSAPTPGEQDIDATLGFVKIGGNVQKPLPSSATVLARVTFQIKNTSKNVTIAFYDYKIDGTGHTLANGAYGSNDDDSGVLPPPPCFSDIIGCRGAPTPLLKGRPADLSVILTLTGGSSSSATSSAGTSANTSSSSSSSFSTGNTGGAVTTSSASSSTSYATSATTGTTGGSSFRTLQVQNLRVTTKDTAAYLLWNALQSAELAGYNVYYGTVSGRYIQRRSVGRDDTSLVIRDLEPGVTYYFAVRGVNSDNVECSFSQEVAVTIGNPETSTAPFIAPAEAATIPLPEGNPIAVRSGDEINGETGIADTVVFTLILSAFIGTILAFRRQMLLSSSSAHVH